MRRFFAFMFTAWGLVGLVSAISSMLSWGARVSVGESSLVSAVALIWIGGLIFFGLPLTWIREDKP